MKCFETFRNRGELFFFRLRQSVRVQKSAHISHSRREMRSPAVRIASVKVFVTFALSSFLLLVFYSVCDARGRGYSPPLLTTSPVLKVRAADDSYYDCEMMATPQDFAPIRSPQTIHGIIAMKVQNKSVIELGTRNGDGISCFAQFASSAIAIEYDKTYCARLEERARLHNPPFWSVQCVDAFKYENFDADIITWWQQNPLTNFAVLKKLKEEQCAGRIRQSAEAILVFDEKWPKDMKDFALLSSVFSWQQRVNFDEYRLCANENARDNQGRDLCYRSKGVFAVASVPISQYPYFKCQEPEIFHIFFQLFIKFYKFFI